MTERGDRAQVLDLAIVGAGPCGLAAAISAMRAGLRTLVFDGGPVVSAIQQYPTYATFFSTAEKLSIGGLPFVLAEQKPTRRDALAYYRAAVRHFGIPVRQYEPVRGIAGAAGDFVVRTETQGDRPHEYRARAVIVATGYWGTPNLLRVPGEELPHVTHAYREGHEAFMRRAVVVGGGNSAAEAALDLWRSGAEVTLAHFGPTFDKRIKPWVLPDFTNRVTEGKIAASWNSRVVAITPEHVVLHVEGEGERRIPADHVYVMTGFAPSMGLLRELGVTIDSATGIPAHDTSTLETDVPGVFVAGVVIAGYDANKVFIENGRFHGDLVVARLTGRAVPPPPRLSAELDT